VPLSFFDRSGFGSGPAISQLEERVSLDLSVVAPAFNEGDVLPSFVERVTAVLDRLDRLDCSAELIVVDDGSTDGTWDVIEAAARVDPRIRGLRLSRNFGHQLALTAGLAAAQGRAVVTLDADLQHPPELIPELIDAGRLGYDVVYAVRSPEDSAGPFKRLSAKLFYVLLNRLTSLELPEGAADFRYMSRRVVDVLVAMPERHRFLRGMTRWAGFRQTFVSYERCERGAGCSKYGLARMLLLAWDAVTSFSAFPLRLAGLVGVCTSIVGWLYLAYAIGVHLFTHATISGWTSMTAAVLILGGVQLVFLGIIGQYMGRMYEEAKGRPLFLIADDTRRADADGGLADLPPALVARGRAVADGLRTLPER
jgi:glycosyltransferase involved in cell wall biosynthesis